MSEKKVAVVTGSSRGIGAAIAYRLAQDGFHVVVNYAGNASAAATVVDKITTQFGAGRAIAVQANLQKLDEVKKLADEALAFGTVTFVCLNAGVVPMVALPDITEAQFNEAFDVNLKGHLFLVQALVPHMPKKSSIVALSTTAVHMTNIASNFILYAASKGALEQTVHVLAKELGPSQIRVNTICPGPISSDMFFEVANTPEKLAFWNSQSPMGRIGEPEEVAAVVSFLAGPDSTWVSGQEIRVDGGGTVG